MMFHKMEMIDEFDWYGSPNREKPKVSVILSTYNRCRREGSCGSLLERAVNSILRQTFEDFELILIDDHSKDGTRAYCLEAAKKDERVQFYGFKQNSALPAKRYNFGISVSRGTYVAFMFDDDEWELNALEDLYGAIEGPYRDCGMVYGLARLYREDEEEILGGRWSWGKIDVGNFISNNAVIVKRMAIDLVGGYDEDPVFLRICDWDLWWRIGRKLKVARVKKRVAIVYSCLPDSIGMTKNLDWRGCRKRQRSGRVLPLMKAQQEPLRCRIRSVLFEIYVRMIPRFRVKMMVKAILPPLVYQFLKRQWKVLYAAFSPDLRG